MMTIYEDVLASYGTQEAGSLLLLLLLLLLLFFVPLVV